MKNWLKILLVFLAVFAVANITGRVTGAFDLFSVSTNSNETTLKKGKKIMASNLIKPERFNLICYKTESEGETQTWVHRLCGMAGDLLQIKNGILFVNGKNADINLTLAHNYFIPSSELSKLGKLMDIQDENVYATSSDSSTLFITDTVFVANKIKGRRYVVPVSEHADEIKKYYKQEWNADHFGPVTVPAGKYFVLGDNRHNSLDSRYIGFIDEASYVATVLFKK